MEINVTMTEEEYEDFKLFREMDDEEYLKSQIRKNYSLLDCLNISGISQKYTGDVEYFPSTNITKIAIHCESQRDSRGDIEVDIRERFKEYKGENGSRWITNEEIRVLGLMVPTSKCKEEFE